MSTDPRSTAAPSELAEMFTGLGRELTTQQTVEEVLATISRRAGDAIPAVEHASVTRRRGGSFETVAATSDTPAQVDRIQYELGSGPCVDAILTRSVQRVGDLARDEKWPEFGARAAQQHGIRSMLSARLTPDDDDLLAGVNLYSSAVDAFDEYDQTVAMLLVTYGALALSAARRQDKVDNLERALHTSRRIGIAIGILMTTHKVTDEQGFNLLRTASQADHRKLHDIAEDVAHTGRLDLPEPRVRR